MCLTYTDRTHDMYTRYITGLYVHGHVFMSPLASLYMYFFQSSLGLLYFIHTSRSIIKKNCIIWELYWNIIKITGKKHFIYIKKWFTLTKYKQVGICFCFLILSASTMPGKWTVMYLCVRGVECASFYDYSIGSWKCSDSVVFFIFHFITHFKYVKAVLDKTR